MEDALDLPREQFERATLSRISAPQSLSAGEDQRHQALRWSWLDRKLLTG
jgi:hypothetical protein